MLDHLSLRLRVLLFFLFLGIGALTILGAASWFIAHRQGSELVGAALIQSSLFAGFGIFGLTVFVWRLFDEHVAKAVETLAVDLRTRAHADVGAELRTDAARYLGDLAPAAASMTEMLGAAKYTAAEEIARKTAQLEAEKSRLAAILSDIPLAVAVMSPTHHVTLYDGQFSALLGDRDPIGLGRTAFDWFDKTILTETYQRLVERSQTTPQSISLLSADHSENYPATMRMLGEGEGYLLAIDVEHVSYSGRPVTFDFSLFDRRVSSTVYETPLKDLTFVVFDTETTGLDTEKDDLVQMGALRVVNGRLVDGEVCDMLVNPGRPIPPASTRIHGITDEMVRGAPPIDEVIPIFSRFASDAVLVAHNAPFDIAFLRRYGERLGIRFDHPIMDTVLLSAAVYGELEEHTLDALAERLGVSLPDEVRHTALGDAQATAAVLLKLIPVLESHGLHTFGDVLSAMRRHQRLLPDLNN
ncbi:3'-5' exonuclease [Coralliovum pocilloporae]|uniref:3'-5' exonuclease n=1 Tax=Coralliovum pocilloporae TaxID=3066369 RepID=UPI0033075EA7